MQTWRKYVQTIYLIRLTSKILRDSKAKKHPNFKMGRSPEQMFLKRSYWGKQIKPQ
jgi:hypothetical protein